MKVPIPKCLEWAAKKAGVLLEEPSYLPTNELTKKVIDDALDLMNNKHTSFASGSMPYCPPSSYAPKFQIGGGTSGFFGGGCITGHMPSLPISGMMSMNTPTPLSLPPEPIYSKKEAEQRLIEGRDWLDTVLGAFDAIEALGYGRPYLAGGAVRDLGYDQPPKDWDIFLLDQGIEKLRECASVPKEELMKTLATIRDDIITKINSDLNSLNTTFRSVKVLALASKPSSRAQNLYGDPIDNKMCLVRPICEITLAPEYKTEADKENTRMQEITIQVMYRPDVMGIVDLIEQFDWNICSNAVRPVKGVQDKVETFSLTFNDSIDFPVSNIVSKKTLLNKGVYSGIITLNEDWKSGYSNPRYSLERGFKIAGKLGLRMKDESFEFLIKKITEGIEAKAKAAEEADESPFPF